MTPDAVPSDPGDGSVGPAGGGGMPPQGDGTPGRALMAFVGLAVAILIVGLVVWISSGGADDAVPSASITPQPATSAPVVTTAAPTVPTTAPPTPAPTPAPSTAPPTTTPPTPARPVFVLPEPGADAWTVPSDYDPVAPEMTLRLAATSGDLRVFDGVVDQLRCVGVVGPGDAVTTWCGPENVATRFIADRGAEPIVVELGAATGSATIAVQSPGWTLGSNGCSDPMATMLAGVNPGALAVTDVICRGDEAFLGVGASLFGPGVAPDGGGILAATGTEGWDVVDFGTSIDCSGQADGVDRCALFGVESELFEALLPLPPADVLGTTSVDIVGVSDRTADVEAWIGGVTDPAEIEAIVTGRLVDPEAEAPAVTRRADTLQFGRLQLLVVEIPQLDDSIATETWAIWIGSIEETSGVTAFSWSTCARGVTGDGLCV